MAKSKTETEKKTVPAKASKAAAAKSAAPAVKEKSVSELISSLADKTGLSKVKVKEFLDSHSEMIVEELKSAGSVHLHGVGKFKVGERAERQGRNPATGEPMTIKASKTVKFSGGKNFKESFK